MKNIQKQGISKEMRDSYLDYAMSVIIARALPDVRDGLKPVHRRILYTMYEERLTHGAKFRKSATVVGSCLGRYHPHGDVAVYDSLARMTQVFSLRYPLIEGQGNFGSIDGDPPAAMRYTECRLSAIGEEILKDIEKETVDFTPNYDRSRKEPKVLPSPLPQLLLNGSLGIAVGMATNIPAHNLQEVCDGLIYLLNNEEASVKDLCKTIRGPDFPTGGQIFDKGAILKTYETGRGAILNRGRAEIVEKKKGIFEILISAIPYGVQKSTMLEEMADLVRKKKLEGIRNIRDESDREGLRIVIELKKDSQPKKILNQLFRWTQLEKNFYVNVVALEDGLQPKTLSLKGMMDNFLSHRKEVIRKRTEFELKKTKERIHILSGLKKALLHIDEIISIIKKSESREEAKRKLILRFKFSEVQTEVILETRLQALLRLEQEKVKEELKDKKKLAEKLETILSRKRGVEKVIEEELSSLREKYGDERKTEVVSQRPGELKEEDLIPEEDNILILTEGGYTKRLSVTSFKSQKRGGKGVIGLALREEDKVQHFLHLNSHDEILFFTNLGRVFKIKAYDIPETERQSFGKGILNFLDLSPNENITSLINFRRSEKKYLIMVTRQGIIKKTNIRDFEVVRRSGLRAIKLKKDDELSFVKESGGNSEILLASFSGNVIMFKEKDLRSMGRNAIGVVGMRFKGDDMIVGMEVIDNKERKEVKKKKHLLTLGERGLAKRTEILKFKLQKRGGKGIIGIKVTSKTGHLASALLTTEEEELVVISQKGQTIRTKIQSMPILGRSSQGVRTISLNKGDKVASATIF